MHNQSESSGFLFDKFFKLWFYHNLNILCKKIPPSVAANGGIKGMNNEPTLSIPYTIRIASKNRQNFYPGDSYV